MGWLITIQSYYHILKHIQILIAQIQQLFITKYAIKL